jgi:hypothetical protein
MNAPARSPTLPVVWRQRPFVGDLKCRILDVGVHIPTIAGIIAGIPENELPRGFAELGEVRINGEVVPRGLWHLVRPKYRPDHETVVTLHVPLGGPSGGSSSGSSGKSSLALVASIAVLLVAAAVSGGALGVLTGGLLAAGTAAASIAGAAIGIGGALAIAALTPRPSLAATPLTAGSTSTPAGPGATAAASLTGNILQPGTSVPRVIGTMQLFPPLACNPLIEVVGDVEYGEAVFVLAGPHALSGSQVGGTSTDGIAELVEQLVEGKPGDAIQTLVQRYSFTTDVNAVMSAHTLDPTVTYNLLDQGNPGADVPQPVPCVGRDGPDEIWINLAWTTGLFSDAAALTLNQAVRVQIRQRGTSNWINLPEVHFSMNITDPFQKVIRIKWGTKPVGVLVPPTNQGPVYAFKHVPGQDGVTALPATAGWTADASFSAGSGGDLLYAGNILAGSNVLNTELYADKVIFYLDPVAFPQDYYELQVTASSAYNSASFNASAYTYPTTVVDFFNYYDQGGGVFRIPEDPQHYHDTVQLTRLSSVWNQNPIQSNDFATMSIKVHSRALDQYSIMAAGYTYDWDGSGWNTFTTTSNPAPHARDVLTGSLSSKPVPVSLINDSEFVAWRTDAISRGLTVNSVVEGKQIMDVLNMITGCTRAAIRHNEKWGVFLDRDRSADTPVQIFSPRNMANFAWTRAYADNPSGILANYVDADNDYDTSAEDIVYADDAVQDADLLSQQTYDGLVHLADIEAQAVFDLKQLKYRFTFYTFDCGADALVAQRGDLVGVQHDIITRRSGASRVVSVIEDGSGNITGLTLDGTVPVFTSAGIQSLASVATAASIQALGEKTGIAIRLKQGAGILVKQITAAVNDDVLSVTFATPFPDPGNLSTDCLVTVGPLGSEYKRLIVYGVQPKAELQATVTCVDEAPQLWETP